jgi:ABC-type nitrate/sulfonate/bicarbonate transport system ATPase subunit
MNIAVDIRQQAFPPTPAPAPRRSAIRLVDLGKVYPAASDRAAVAQVSLDVAEGGFLSLIGRSGSGKSTLLRLMSGLIAPSSGRLEVEGRAVRGPPASVRYVFQDYGQSLFPWMSARRNVMFGARHAPNPERDARAVADQYLELVGLADVGERYPWELSGGMQQRLAIARALASRPRILLMDEPFGAVDALSRARLQDLALRLWQELSLTIVLVTHDIDEAVYLSERVVVLEPAGQGVLADVEIGLDWPRSQLATREDPRFSAYRRRLHELVLG